MAQTSTTISSQKSFKSATSVSEGLTFTASSKRISASSTTIAGSSGSVLAVRDIFTTNSSTNPGPFTVSSIDSNGLYVVVEETVADESPSGTSTITPTGFVTDKYKGDGYYSQADGVHTVAYHVSNTLVGSIKMQGSLATTPTEDDWFDITGTAFTADGSTLVASYNFTGNFVWVRAKTTGITAGTISKILYNN